MYAEGLLKGLSSKSLDFINYLSFKEDCLREQEELGWKLNVIEAENLYEKLLRLKSTKYLALKRVMPKVPVTKDKKPPKVRKKADGSPSSNWLKWLDTCKEHRKHPDSRGFKVVEDYLEPNPDSHNQIKGWLFNLGWSPTSFKYSRNTQGEVTAIPQVRVDGELCESVEKLMESYPELEHLGGYTVLTHRSQVVSGLLDKVDSNGYVQASSQGYTNTLRFKHVKPLVNLPGVDKEWGKEIRGLLMAPEGKILLGCDMVSLEDTTGRHYQQPFDPEYVRLRSDPDFDPHLDLARFCGAITQQDYEDHQTGVKDLSKLRKGWKVTNYSATYGIKAESLSRGVGCTIAEAQRMLDGFWDRNHSIIKVANSLRVKNGWLLNPLSGFYYKLRNVKDKFSTVNQGTGVFCFDTFVKECRSRGLPIIGQFHDEIIALVDEGKQDWASGVLEDSIRSTNEILSLNIDLGIDYKFGKTYADIH